MPLVSRKASITKIYINFIILLLFFQINCASHKQDKSSKNCAICKGIVASVDQILSDTKSSSYESGNSEWEKKALVKYEDSELRLLHIMERLCSNTSDKRKCNTFVDVNEEYFEEWFKTQRKENISLFDHLCVERAKVCCPPRRFGRSCDTCQGFVNGVLCSGHGSCHGDGTRKGDGSCECEPEYVGTMCELCASTSYNSSDGSCIPCHKSCDGSCVNHTAEGCQGNCNPGWEKNAKGFCEDINECLLDTTRCAPSKLCINTPGKFFCQDCYNSCLTCNGEGANRCLTCKPGYIKSNENTCVDIDECTEGKHTCEPTTYCLNTVGGFKCKKCDKACLKGCEGPLMKDCHDCKNGYRKIENDTGCEDIDECSNEKNSCPEGKYCLNKPGKFSCKKCDEACHLCFGPGAYSCYSCSESYKMDKGVCIDTSKPTKAEDDDGDADL